MNAAVHPIYEHVLAMNVLVLRFCDFLVRTRVHVFPMNGHILPICDLVHRNYDFVLPTNDTLERNYLILRNLSANRLCLTIPKTKPPASNV
jgi:hypothetical protein